MKLFSGMLCLAVAVAVAGLPAHGATYYGAVSFDHSSIDPSDFKTRLAATIEVTVAEIEVTSNTGGDVAFEVDTEGTTAATLNAKLVADDTYQMGQIGTVYESWISDVNQAPTANVFKGQLDFSVDTMSAGAIRDQVVTVLGVTASQAAVTAYHAQEGLITAEMHVFKEGTTSKDVSVAVAGDSTIIGWSPVHLQFRREADTTEAVFQQDYLAKAVSDGLSLQTIVTENPDDRTPDDDTAGGDPASDDPNDPSVVGAGAASSGSDGDDSLSSTALALIIVGVVLALLVIVAVVVVVVYCCNKASKTEEQVAAELAAANSNGAAPTVVATVAETQMVPVTKAEPAVPHNDV